MSLRHASIIPLIGGETIGQQLAFGSKPDYLLSYSCFSNNDSHLVNYYQDVPYILLDEREVHPRSVDVVNAVCPCAGLSSLSVTSSVDSPVNDWLVITAKYVLSDIKPFVFWGENAPRLSTKMGEPIVHKLMSIAKENGYTLSLYKTKSLLHGLCQVRERTFYFFWKGDKIPLLNYFERPHTKIEDVIRSVPVNSFQNYATNLKIPSKDDLYYRYILEVIEGGINHKDFFVKLKTTKDVMHYIEESGHSYRMVKDWMLANNYSSEAIKMDKIQDKLDSGHNIMRRCSVIGKDYIGAFVGYLAYSLVHPDYDRYITYREAMTIMGMPNDFELLNPQKNINHICQNVPVQTAYDMASEIKAVLNNEREFVKCDLLYQSNIKKSHEIKDTSKTLLDFGKKIVKTYI